MKKAEWPVASFSPSALWLCHLPTSTRPTSLPFCPQAPATSELCTRDVRGAWLNLSLRRQVDTGRCLSSIRTPHISSCAQLRFYSAPTPSTSDVHTPSAANRSAAEVAFEAAMFGAFAHPSVMEHSASAHASADTALNEAEDVVDVVGVHASPQAEKNATDGSAVRRAHDTLIHTKNEEDCTALKLSSTASAPPSRRRADGPAQEQHQAESLSLSEEAFERALYNNIFEIANGPAANEEELTATTESAKAEVTQVSDTTTSSSNESNSTETVAAAARRGVELSSAAAEAAFERAMFGLDTTEPESTVDNAREENQQGSSPATLLHTTNDSENVVDARKSANAAGHANGKAEGAALTEPQVLGNEDSATTTPTTFTSSCTAAANAPQEVEMATTHQMMHSSTRREMTLEEELDFDEDEHLFEADERQNMPRYVPFAAPVPSKSVAAGSPAQDEGNEIADAEDEKSSELADKETSALHDAEHVEDPLLPPPPPTVSMTCPFQVDACDDLEEAGVDAKSLRDALFGIADHGTTVVTHREPVERVESCMPLLDHASKIQLFYESGWLLQLEEQEERWRRQARRRHDSTSTPLEGDNKSLDSVAAPSAAPEFDSAFFQQAAAPKLSRGLSTAEESDAVPFTHREVVGRSKVLRCLIFRLLRSPQLWWDAVQEVVEAAVAEAQARASRSKTIPDKSSDAAGVEFSLDDVIIAEESLSSQDAAVKEPSLTSPPLCEVLTTESVHAAMSRVFGTHPLDVHFFSDALQRELVNMCRSAEHNATAASAAPPSQSCFAGPAATWKAFVLAHRLDHTRVCGPHVKPFSYGEFRPTITAAELAPLRYCNAVASWSAPPSEERATAESVASNADLSPSSPSVPLPGSAALSGASKPVRDDAAQQGTRVFADLSEAEQNAFLFGEASAQLSTKVRSSDGIFLVYGQDGVSFEEQDRLRAAEQALKEAEEKKRALQEETDWIDTQPRLSPLEKARADEMARVRLYDVDRVVLELTNAEGRPRRSGPSSGDDPERSNPEVPFLSAAATSSAFLWSVAFPPTASPEQRPSSGRGRGRGARSGRQAKAASPFQMQLQNCEDVQLAALWHRFLHASTGELLDNLVHVQHCETELLCAAAAELLVQKAFWLLFYSRDEVRAVTHPMRTYETVWNLHDQLVELVTLSLDRKAENAQESSTGGNLSTAVEAAQLQTSNRPAFNALPLASQVTYACFGCAHMPFNSTDTALVVAPALPTPLKGPKELYDALRKMKAEIAKKATPNASSTASFTAESYQSLSDEQQLAVGFCFPRNASEVSEERGRTAAVEQDVLQEEPESIVDFANGMTVVSAKAEDHTTAASHESMRDTEPARPATEKDEENALNVALVASEANDGEDREPLCETEGDDNNAAGVPVNAALPSSSDTQPPETEVNVIAEESEKTLRRLKTRQQVRDAVEASLYNCIANLQAAGLLPVPSMLVAIDSISAVALTAAQKAAIQRAADAVVASLHDAEVAERTNAVEEHAGSEDSNTRDGVAETAIHAAIKAVTAAKLIEHDHTREEEKQSLTRQRTRRRGKRTSVPSDRPTKAIGEAPATTGIAAVTRHRRRRGKNAADRVEADAVGVQPVKRKQGRPPRRYNADGSYTKSPYVHSAAYLERKKRKEQGQLL